MANYTLDLCTGGTAFAEQTNITPAINAFDDNSDGYYQANITGASKYVGYILPEAKTIQKYTLESNISYHAYMPTAWFLEGSNNGTIWTQVDARTNQTDWSASVLKKEYTFSNSTAYTQYRLVFTDSMDQVDYHIIFTEIEMMEFIGEPIMASSIYGGSHRGNVRGKAAEGFIRPTLKQFFMTTPDFKEISSIPELAGYSADLCEGGTPAASHSYINGGFIQTADKAFDNGTNFWQVYPGAYPCQIQYQFNEPKKIIQYTLTSQSTYPDRMPGTWTFEGSNDGNNWDILDTHTGFQHPLTYGTPTTTTYQFDNEISYLYYRLNITEKNTLGGPQDDGIIIQEIEMMEGVYE